MCLRKNFVLGLVVFLLTCFVGMHVFAASSEISENVSGKTEALYFVGDDDFPPYSFMNKGKVDGIDCSIIRELAKRLNREVTIELRPWKRLLNLVKEGKCDGAFSLFKTVEREKFALYATSVPIHFSEMAIFVKKGKAFEFNTVTDLYGKRVGKNFGFNIEDEFDRALVEKKIMVEEVEGVHKNIKLVLDDKIDCFVDNYQVTLHVLQQMNLLDEIDILPKRMKKRRKAYLVLSKKGAQENKEKLLANINRTLQEMEDDGTIQKINDDWVKILLKKNV